jgi:hypothetical protein
LKSFGFRLVRPKSMSGIVPGLKFGFRCFLCFASAGLPTSTTTITYELVSLPVPWQKACLVCVCWAVAEGPTINTTAASARASAAITAIRPPLPNPFIAALMYHPPRWSAFSLPYTFLDRSPPRITALPEPSVIYPPHIFPEPSPSSRPIINALRFS